jgi:hypothetical protein
MAVTMKLPAGHMEVIAACGHLDPPYHLSVWIGMVRQRGPPILLDTF